VSCAMRSELNVLNVRTFLIVGITFKFLVSFTALVLSYLDPPSRVVLYVLDDLAHTLRNLGCSGLTLRRLLVVRL
jgi:hypothetical protein